MRNPFVLVTWLLALSSSLSSAESVAPHPDRAGEKWARKTLGSLSVEEKVGQLFMIWVRAQFWNSSSPDYLKLRDDLIRHHIGSVALSVPVEGTVLLKSRPEEAALLLNRLQADSKRPLLVAADFEAGVSVRLTGATEFPQAMAFGAASRLERALAFGRITAEEARAVGVHWNFFPVADLNSNPANPIINTRSFGEDPRQVGELLAAYIAGAREGGMLTTAKHFPGHGDTETDSHFGVARVGGDRERLETVELPPFRRAIEAGVDAVMVAHVTVPALEPAPDRVATTSSAVVTDLLKTQWGFKGLVVTDALDMAGLTRLYAASIGRASVEAFKAGNDMLLIPADLDASCRSMVEAVRTGEISTARLDESVLKVLKLKASLGLPRARVVDVGRVASVVGRPENVALGQQVADEAVTLVRDDGHVIPLRRPGSAAAGERPAGRGLVAIVLSDDVRGRSGRVLEREIQVRVPDANVIFVDGRIADAVREDVLQAVSGAETVVVAAFVAPSPGQSAQGSGPGDPTGRLLQGVLDRAGDKTTVIAVGSPYVAQHFPRIRTYLCTLSSASVSERSAVKALFGEMALGGRLPVRIPGVAGLGEGITREASR